MLTIHVQLKATAVEIVGSKMIACHRKAESLWSLISPEGISFPFDG
jgi:hypothetical protein